MINASPANPLAPEPGQTWISTSEPRVRRTIVTADAVAVYWENATHQGCSPRPDWLKWARRHKPRLARPSSNDGTPFSHTSSGAGGAP